MKVAKTILIFTLVLFSFDLYSQTIFVSGNIESNTTWSADTVKLAGSVYVVPGIVLSVEPGTYIESQGYYRINVAGSIRAIGTLADSIVFTVHDTTGFWQNTYSVLGGWEGFNIKNGLSTTDTSIFEYCRIQYGKKYLTNGDNIEGAGINANDYGTLIIKNSLLRFNMVINHEYGGPVSKGGAVYCSHVNSVHIRDNSFIRNRSFDRGGAIYIGNQCQSDISDNIFIKNKAWNTKLVSGVMISWGSGAAIATDDPEGPSPVIANNYCFNNYTVSGIIQTRNLGGLVFNNLICNNFGIGIDATYYFSQVRIFNNTIVNNNAHSGGIFLYSEAIIYNNIIWGNKSFPVEIVDQIQLLTGVPQFHPVLSYNSVEHGNGGTGSINTYPDFVSPSEGFGIEYDGAEADWSLLDSSPCINAGTPDTSGLFLPSYDINLEPRIYGAGIEMGAYENQHVLVGLNDAETTNTLIYPNPGISRLNIESNGSETCFELKSISGQSIIRRNFTDNKIILNTESLNPGIYIYRLYNLKKGIVETGKWIKTDK